MNGNENITGPISVEEFVTACEYRGELDDDSDGVYVIIVYPGKDYYGDYRAVKTAYVSPVTPNHKHDLFGHLTGFGNEYVYDDMVSRSKSLYVLMATGDVDFVETIRRACLLQLQDWRCGNIRAIEPVKQNGDTLNELDDPDVWTVPANISELNFDDSYYEI